MSVTKKFHRFDELESKTEIMNMLKTSDSSLSMITAYSAYFVRLR